MSTPQQVTLRKDREMAPKLRLKTPPFYTLEGEGELFPSLHVLQQQGPRRTRAKSELQRKFSAVVRRLIGAPSHSHTHSHPHTYTHIHDISRQIPPRNNNNALLPPSPLSLDPSYIDDDDDCSNYGDFENHEDEEKYTALQRTESITSITSITSTTSLSSSSLSSAASSYTSLASLNPYVVDAADLGALLTPSFSPSFPPLTPMIAAEDGNTRITGERESESERAEDDIQHALAQQLDSAHAAVVAGEDAALRELQLQARLDLSVSGLG